MKRLVLAVVLSALPYGICPTLAGAQDGAAVGDGQPVIVEGKAHVWVSDDGAVHVGEGEGNAFFYAVSADDGPGDGRSEAASQARTVRVERIGPENRRAWLGVSIDDVPPVLADQLELGDEGVVIVNVVKDSPADRAGLQAHDVILTIAGETVAEGPKDAVALISTREPGENVNVVVLRDGRESVFTVTLASAEDVRERKMEWKLELVPEAEIEDEVKTRGRMVFRGPEGKWITKELDQLDELKDLPDSIRMFLPRSGHRVMKFSGEDGDKHLKIKVERDGTTIIVEQKGDGDITVRRVAKDGHEVVDSYASPEDLKAADEEAYRLYKRSGSAAVFQFNVDGIADLPEFEFDGSFDVDLDLDDAQWREKMDEWNVNLDESLAEAREAYQQAMQQFHETMKNLHEEKGLPPVGLFQLADPSKEGPAAVFMRRLGKPRQTFEVRADGTIEARIRKGDSELVRLFDGEDDLANRAPDLYRKYEDLMYVEPE